MRGTARVLRSLAGLTLRIVGRKRPVGRPGRGRSTCRGPSVAWHRRGALEWMGSSHDHRCAQGVTVVAGTIELTPLAASRLRPARLSRKVVKAAAARGCGALRRVVTV